MPKKKNKRKKKTNWSTSSWDKHPAKKCIMKNIDKKQEIKIVQQIEIGELGRADYIKKEKDNFII